MESLKQLARRIDYAESTREWAYRIKNAGAYLNSAVGRERHQFSARIQLPYFRSDATAHSTTLITEGYVNINDETLLHKTLNYAKRYDAR